MSYQMQIAYFTAGRTDEAQREYDRSQTLSGDRSLIEAFYG